MAIQRKLSTSMSSVVEQLFENDPDRGLLRELAQKYDQDPASVTTKDYNLLVSMKNVAKSMDKLEAEKNNFLSTDLSSAMAATEKRSQSFHARLAEFEDRGEILSKPKPPDLPPIENSVAPPPPPLPSVENSVAPPPPPLPPGSIMDPDGPLPPLPANAQNDDYGPLPLTPHIELPIPAIPEGKPVKAPPSMEEQLDALANLDTPLPNIAAEAGVIAGNNNNQDPDFMDEESLRVEAKPLPPIPQEHNSPYLETVREVKEMAAANAQLAAQKAQPANQQPAADEPAPVISAAAAARKLSAEAAAMVQKAVAEQVQKDKYAPPAAAPQAAGPASVSSSSFDFDAYEARQAAKAQAAAAVAQTEINRNSPLQAAASNLQAQASLNVDQTATIRQAVDSTIDKLSKVQDKDAMQGNYDFHGNAASASNDNDMDDPDANVVPAALAAQNVTADNADIKTSKKEDAYIVSQQGRYQAISKGFKDAMEDKSPAPAAPEPTANAPGMKQ